MSDVLDHGSVGSRAQIASRAMSGIGPLEILIVLIILSWIPAVVVAGMKGRWVWLVLGLLLWFPAYIGALLPARAGSSWAQRRA